MKFIKTIFITFVLMSFFILSKVNASTLGISSASYTTNGTNWQSLPYWSADNRYDFNPYNMVSIRLNMNLTSCSSGGQYNFTFYTDPNYSLGTSMVDTTTLNGVSCSVSVTQTGNAYVSCPNVASASSYQLQFRPYILPQSFTMGIVKEYSVTCGFDSNSIINNNNSNTNNIINNNNNNTEEIINNQNELLGDECENLYNYENYQSGSIANNQTTEQLTYTNQALTTNWITVEPNTTYYLTGDNNRNRWQLKNGNTITYGGENRYVNTGNNTQLRVYYYWSDTATTGQQHKVSISKNNSYCEYGSYQSKLDTTNSAINDNTQAINDVNNSINNNNVSGANQDANNFVNNQAFQDNTGLSGIITAPLSVINSLTSTCSPIRLPIPYLDTNVDIPCIGDLLASKMGALIQLVKVVINGYICYLIGLDMFKIVKHARDPDDDRIEVLDL